MNSPKDDYTGQRTDLATDPVPVNGLPRGLAAWPVYTRRYRGGEPIGEPRLHSLRIAPTVATPLEPVAAVLEHLSSRQRRFVLGKRTRTARTIAGQFGTDIADLAELIRGGVVVATVDPPPIPDGPVGALRGWELTDPACTHAEQLTQQRAAHAEQLHTRAQELATALDEHDTDAAPLAALLTQPDSAGGHLDLLLAAGEALLEGRRYTGVRGFASDHRGDTKLADIDRILEKYGIPTGLRERLGVLRNHRMALFGPVTVSTADATMPLAGIRGPVSLLADQPHLQLHTRADTLIVLENEEAATYVNHHRPDLAGVWTAGYMHPTVLQQIGALAQQCRVVWVICDADTDGVHIAASLLEAAPHSTLVDVGAFPHTARRARPTKGRRTLTGFRTDPDTPAQLQQLAEQVATRGYDVEQEAVMPHILTTLTGIAHKLHV